MRKKPLLAHLLFLCLTLFTITTTSYAQNIDIAGHVSEEGGAPAVGATITVKGSSKATITNATGDFIINAKKGSSIIITYVGFVSQTVQTNGSVVNVNLVPGKDLNEVVVTALGIKKEKRALGYSVSEVKGDELTQARSVNIANSLVGKVAGLNVSSTATGPGGATRITIRGNASIKGENQPLIVVDGIPFNNSNLTIDGDANNIGGSVGTWGGSDQGDGISSLNPDEIESVSVLKGGTAAALYGSRASNGAILVTTKGGAKSGKAPVIEIGSNFVVEDILDKKLKDYQFEYGTGDKGTGIVGVKPTVADPNLNQTNSWGAK
ncbi:MAG: TonB-dependent receptor plug domain-containing protein, partial [Flavitalea sp.]